MAYPKVNVEVVLGVIKMRRYKNIELIYIDSEPCLEAVWTEPQFTAFCAEFGVSGHRAKTGYIICNLHQPYNPQIRFEDAARALAMTAADIERRKPEIIEFARMEMQNNPAGSDEDLWSEFSDGIDVQISVCDDPESDNFGKPEIWAYPTITNSRNEQMTDTNDECFIGII